MIHVHDKHVRAWLDDHDATVVPASEAASFATALERLPWLGSSPDWSAVGVVRLRLDSPDFWQELGRTDLGRFDYAFLMYGPAEPGIVAPIREILEGIDVLAWSAPGVRYLCAAVRVGEEWRVEPEVFGAYDGTDHLLVRA